MEDKKGGKLEKNLGKFSNPIGFIRENPSGSALALKRIYRTARKRGGKPALPLRLSRTILKTVYGVQQMPEIRYYCSHQSIRGRSCSAMGKKQ